jgi:hypothetical protein
MGKNRKVPEVLTVLYSRAAAYLYDPDVVVVAFAQMARQHTARSSLGGTTAPIVESGAAREGAYVAFPELLYRAFRNGSPSLLDQRLTPCCPCFACSPIPQDFACSVDRVADSSHRGASLVDMLHFFAYLLTPHGLTGSFERSGPVQRSRAQMRTLAYQKFDLHPGYRWKCASSHSSREPPRLSYPTYVRFIILIK